MERLAGKEFIGIVLTNEDVRNLDLKIQGRYKVHIPKLLPHIPETSGLWVKNHVNKWNISSSDYGEYGQHFPIQPGTKVIIKFFSDDYNSGYIDRIVSDFEEGTDVLAQDCTEKKNILTDRDEQYVICKTPKLHNVLYINELTDKSNNELVIVFNRDKESKYTERVREPVNRERRTVLRIDDSGVHVWTADNYRLRILLDHNQQIDGDKTEYIKGYNTIHIDKDYDIHIHKNQRINVDGYKNEWIKGDTISNYDGNDLSHYKGNRNRLTEGKLEDEIQQEKIETIGASEDTTIGDYQRITIGGEKDEYIEKELRQSVGKDRDDHIGKNLNIEVEGMCNISVKGSCNIKSEGSVNINGGPMINLNCNPPASYIKSKVPKKAKKSTYPDSKPVKKYKEEYVSTREDSDIEEVQDSNHRYNSVWTNDGLKHAQISKTKTHVRDLGPNETIEYEYEDEYSDHDKDKRERLKTVGKKCDDVTKGYNIDKRESLTGKKYV